MPGPLSRRSRGVHLPVSSSTSSAFPRTLSRSASRVSPSKRFHDGSPFRDCSHFVMFRPSGLLASQIVPTAAAYRRRAAEAFTSELNMLRCLRMHRICLPPAQAIGGVGTCTPRDSQPCRLLQCKRLGYVKYRRSQWTRLQARAAAVPRVARSGRTNSDAVGVRS